MFKSHLKQSETKPYNTCLRCESLGIKCDGPNFLAMSTERWCEWCKTRKDDLHREDPKWTNAYIAEITGISKVTIDRIMAGTCGDIRTSTTREITKALINGSWGQYPCANPPTETVEVLVDNPALVKRMEEQKAEIDKLRVVIDNQIQEHKEDILRAEKQYDKKVDYLKTEVNEQKKSLMLCRFAITGLVVLLIALLSIIIAALVIDKLNPDLGFFWVH